MAVPVSGTGESGVLVAAKVLNDEHDRVESAVRIAAGVSIVITLLASLFIWLAAGRAVQPLRALARTTRSITRPICPSGSTSRARSPSWGGPSTACSTASIRVRLAEGVPRRRRPRAANPDHGDPRSHGHAGGRPQAARGSRRDQRGARADDRLVDDLLLLARRTGRTSSGSAAHYSTSSPTTSSARRGSSACAAG